MAWVEVRATCEECERQFAAPTAGPCPRCGVRPKNRHGRSPYRYRVGWRDSAGRRRSETFGSRAASDEKLRTLDPHQKPRPTISFAQQWESFIESRDFAPATVALYTSLAGRFLLPALADRPLESLTPNELAGWVSEARKKTGRASVGALVGLLKSILSQAVDQDLIGSNPAARLKKPVPPAREAQVVDAKAIEELRAAMSPRYRCMVDLMGWAGLRIGEVAGLKTTDLKRGRVQIVRSLSEVSGHITEQPPKARQKRAVTLPPMVVERLRAHIDAGYPAGGWLFPAPGGGPLRLRNWRSREWVPATKAVGLPGLTPHSLRHSHVAVLASQGVPIKTAADRLGHSSPTVTLRVYSHTFPSVEAAVVDGLQEAITEAAKAARPRLTAVPD